MRREWTKIPALAMLAALPGVTLANDRRPLGEIEFFGYRGLDVGAIRSALPFHEGDLFPPAKVKSSADLKRQVSEKVEQIIGREPTSISFVCCDSKQDWMVYIGLPGQSYRALAFNPAPDGEIRLPSAAVTLNRALDKVWVGAVMNGRATEDDSEGFTLTSDPKARKEELAVRDYALHNEPRIFGVLASSSDASHRAIAARMIGYGRQSGEQIDALIHASLDPDDDVRNNAVRALEVLAGARPDLSQRIPLEPFTRLIRSGAWSDRNKASLLLLALTKRRDSRVLAPLRAEALDPLVEMARWRYAGHAEAALLILGRIAGIDEETLGKLVGADRAAEILAKLDRQ